MTKEEEKYNKIYEMIDKSNYLRGLLILIRKDKNVWDHEHAFFLEESSTLGFDREFSLNALKELIGNKYIDNTPPVFYDKKYAARFIIRSLFMISQNYKIHPEEINFLTHTARLNQLSDKWEKRIIPQVMAG